MFLRSPFKSNHEENRLKHEGDVVRARELYFSPQASGNLKFLLSNRYEWMNRYIKPGDRGMDVGCGTGLSKEFIRAREFLLTDFAQHPWLDVKGVDALSTPFKDGEFDFVVSSNMIHHLPYPVKFFREMHRVLKPGGLLLVQEINASFCTRLILRLLRHEGYSFEPDVFDPEVICTDPADLWSANCAIPNLLFDAAARFEARVPEFKILRQSYSELITLLNSGGVIAKAACLSLPVPLLKAVKGIDDILSGLFPSVFAMQRQAVLQKV